MLKIYIARHGQDLDNAAGILNGHRNQPLSDLGISQANQLAENLKKSNILFDIVYSSPLTRAYTTAEIICDALQIGKPVMKQELIERDFGIMTGKLISEIENLCAPDIMKSNPITYFLHPEGAETFPELLERGRSVVEWIKNNHFEGSILLVGHGDIGKMMFAAYYNIPWEDILTQFYFGNSELLLLAEGTHPEKRHVYTAEQYN